MGRPQPSLPISGGDGFACPPQVISGAILFVYQEHQSLVLAAKHRRQDDCYSANDRPDPGERERISDQAGALPAIAEDTAVHRKLDAPAISAVH
ncbi:MAG TPA: hypothetical protein PLX89_17005, partial [Verrucomicrobiota bacterium]|nr:hypothetical protein [Verrucomicrobiota bacterium]